MPAVARQALLPTEPAARHGTVDQGHGYRPPSHGRDRPCLLGHMAAAEIAQALRQYVEAEHPRGVGFGLGRLDAHLRPASWTRRLGAPHPQVWILACPQ